MINPPTEPSVLYIQWEIGDKSHQISFEARFLCAMEIRKQVKQRHQSRIRCLEDDRAVSARIARNWRRSSRTKTLFPGSGKVKPWGTEDGFKACSNNRWSSRATPIWIVSISERTTSYWLLTNGSGNWLRPKCDKEMSARLPPAPGNCSG